MNVAIKVGFPQNHASTLCSLVERKLWIKNIHGAERRGIFSLKKFHLGCLVTLEQHWFRKKNEVRGVLVQEMVKGEFGA